MLKHFIHRRVMISMLFTALTLLGYISYKNLSLELLPSVELPFLIIQVNSARDMDPGYIEREAVIPLEGAAGMLEGIERMESFCERRQGRIIVYYDAGTNLKYAYLKMQEKVDAVKSSLSSEFFVQVVKIDTELLANMFMNLQIRGGGGVDRIRNVVEDKMRRELESIDGIASVEVFGGREKSVEIILNEEKSAAYNITPGDIRNLIARNSQNKMYLGQISRQNSLYFINLVANYRQISDLQNIVVNPAGPVLLKDIAEIRFDVKEEASISRVNGKEAVTVQLVRDARVNIIEVSDATRIVIDRLNQQLGNQDIEIFIQLDTADFLRDNLDLIQNLALTGGLLAVLILWFFLRNLRLVVVISLALPISILTAFNLFYAFDITLNSLTLVGMALAVGMLLDNSIVVLENIYRLRRLGRTPQEAVITGTKEVWRSIAAATLTTVTVFVPFVFAENYMVRILGYQIGVSIISTLFVSLTVALLFIPMAAYFFLEKNDSAGGKFTTISLKSRLVQLYTLLLKSTMRFPLRTVAATLIIFFSSILIAIAISLTGQRNSDESDINLYVTMPGGSTLETTDIAVSDLEKRLQDITEVEDLVSQIYEEEAVLTLRLKEDYQDIAGLRVADVKELVSGRVEDFRTAEVDFEQPQAGRRFRGGGGEFGDVFERMLGIGDPSETLLIKGRDYEVMRRVAGDIEYQLENLPRIERVRMNVADNRPEIQLLFDKEILENYGVTLTAIAAQLASFQKEYATGTRFMQGVEEFDILIRSEKLEDKNGDDLKTLPIPSSKGGVFPLAQVSRIIYAEGRSAINRINQERQVEITYRFGDEVQESAAFLEEARGEVEQLISAMEIPAGIAVEKAADEADLSDFYFLTAIAFLLIYMILAAVFESLLNPLVIIFTIPLAGIGSLWAIIFTGSTILNANTLIGFLILLGIVVNNGIILIDYTRQLRQRGYRRTRALMTAGNARLRPILITAITTVVAMMPLAMGKVEYVTSIASPFAITVIGGLSLSTVFTLVFIPTVYSGLEAVMDWLKHLGWPLRIIQAVLFVASCVIIYLQVDSIIWRFVNLFVVLFAIPGITWFVMNSLRQAREEYIRIDQRLVIKIKNLYKIYDHPTRFIREWRKPERMSVIEGGSKEPGHWTSYAWQYALFVFLVYFVYFYLDHNFWLFLLSLGVYFYTIFMVNGLQLLLAKIPVMNKWSRRARLPQLILWGMPAVNLIVYALRWQNPYTTVLIAALWYVCVIIYTTSNRLQKQLVDIHRLSGRFHRIRRRFYGLIQRVPVLGKKKKSFKALAGISLEIGQGMFGLLGPNGAGKTTLMRIICGILEQNYGSITINDIDVKEKREELQGLIGYLPQEFGTYENMTAAEFLHYQAILKNIYDKEEREERVNYVLSAVHMQHNGIEKIGSFSGGMKQRIGIAQTLLHLPRILVVDEPTAGLDPRERIRFRNLLVELSRERIVIFSTHIIEDIASSCDRVAVLNRGSMKYLGHPGNMADLTKGYVWQCLIDSDSLERMRNQYTIVHHIRVKDRIRLRLLAASKPFEDAISVPPTLEDSYLWLLESKNGNRVNSAD